MEIKANPIIYSWWLKNKKILCRYNWTNKEDGSHCSLWYHKSDPNYYSDFGPPLVKDMLANCSDNPNRPSRYFINGRWYDEDVAVRIVEKLMAFI